MTHRKTISRKMRAQIFQTANGQCHICGGRITAGQAWEVEHIIPLALGGDDEAGNMAPAHAKCHRAKTKQDAGSIAKAKRVEAKHKGFKPRASRPMPFGKWSKLKKKINGSIVDR